MKPPPWTECELEIVEEGLHEGLSDAAIARSLSGRTALAVRIIRKRRGLGSVTAHTLNARKVAAMLGIACAKSVVRCVEMGLLEGKQRHPRGGNKQWLFTEEAVLEFMRNPASWPAWMPERIADSALREWAFEIRRERYLSAGEIARRYCVGRQTVSSWLERGLLPCIRYGNRWVPESALCGFVPPCERERTTASLRRFTPAEDGRLLMLRSAGWAWERIAEDMGRPLGSVAGRWHRLNAKGAA